MAKHLARIFGTEDDKVNCPFYFKVGLCRHGAQCTRVHNKPLSSTCLVLKNMYDKPEDGSVNDFEQFYEEVYIELCKFGTICDMMVAENPGAHLYGSVYIKFSREEEALHALHKLHGRFFSGKLLQPDLLPFRSFYDASCRQNDSGKCGHVYCNFIHWHPVSKELTRKMEEHVASVYPSRVLQTSGGRRGSSRGPDPVKRRRDSNHSKGSPKRGRKGHFGRRDHSRSRRGSSFRECNARGRTRRRNCPSSSREDRAASCDRRMRKYLSRSRSASRTTSPVQIIRKKIKKRSRRTLRGHSSSSDDSRRGSYSRSSNRLSLRTCEDMSKRFPDIDTGMSGTKLPFHTLPTTADLIDETSQAATDGSPGQLSDHDDECRERVASHRDSSSSRSYRSTSTDHSYRQSPRRRSIRKGTKRTKQFVAKSQARAYVQEDLQSERLEHLQKKAKLEAGIYSEFSFKRLDAKTDNQIVDKKYRARNPFMF